MPSSGQRACMVIGVSANAAAHAGHGLRRFGWAVSSGGLLSVAGKHLAALREIQRAQSGTTGSDRANPVKFLELIAWDAQVARCTPAASSGVEDLHRPERSRRPPDQRPSGIQDPLAVARSSPDHMGLMDSSNV